MSRLGRRILLWLSAVAVAFLAVAWWIQQQHLLASLGVPAARRTVHVAVQPAVADRVRITVRDQGAGIAPENLARIFQSGFSTKHDGHGLGLHGCANSVAEMGGRLWAESEGLDRGATFCLELPRVEVPVGAPA